LPPAEDGTGWRPPGHRDLYVASWLGIGRNKDIVAPGLVGDTGEPATIWRQGSVARIPGRPKQRNWTTMPVSSVVICSDLRYNSGVTSASERRVERAKARSSWPIRRYALGAEPGENIRGWTTPTERLAMMWELSRQAWVLSGLPLPDYPRNRAPGRVVRPRQ